jgi:hypothetical protein
MVVTTKDIATGYSISVRTYPSTPGKGAISSKYARKIAAVAVGTTPKISHLRLLSADTQNRSCLNGRHTIWCRSVVQLLLIGCGDIEAHSTPYRMTRSAGSVKTRN